MRGLESLVGAEQVLTRVFFGGLSLFVVYLFLGWFVDRSSAPHIREAEAFRARAADAVSFADSVAAVAAEREARMVGLQAEIVTLKAVRPRQAVLDSQRLEVSQLYAELSDSVLEEHEIIPKQQALIVAQDSTIRIQDAVIGHQERLLVLKDSTIVDLSLSRDSLRSVLMTIPKPMRDDIFLGFIPKPSRKTSFLMGIIGGAVVTAAVIM